MKNIFKNVNNSWNNEQFVIKESLCVLEYGVMCLIFVLSMSIDV